jgi:NADH:ubiquinone oxidoreductase subunit F (NADH-binding)
VTGGSSDHGHTVRTLLSRGVDELSEVGRTVLSHGPLDQIPHDSDHDYAAVDSERWRINVYAGRPAEQRYESVRRFIANCQTDEQRRLESDRIIKALEVAGLLGMGGAGGRTYKKWSEVREAQGSQKYVVCNGDESEPGTFKDRELLLRTPHLVLEGVLLAGLLLGATRGYLYIRHEYEEQIAAMEREIEAARRMGVCGDNILGSGLAFSVEVFVSPGGYICGEQTALIQAIEDKRAEPRNRPPELQTNGLWDMPTLLNNVETLAWVPSIVLKEEGKWYAQQGARAEFKGARFFSISGDVARPGVYEVPIGITLGGLIDQAGGMRDGQSFKAVALSGPSGGFLPATLPVSSFPPAIKERLPANATEVNVRDLELDVALFRKWNLMLGGGIVVYGEDADMVEQARVCSEFYRQESCGKCVPCRIGSTKLAELADALQAGDLDKSQIESLRSKTGQVMELATIMRQTAICGLGTVAANPLTTLLTHFDDDVRQHARQ